jgi:hypothetical protein
MGFMDEDKVAAALSQKCAVCKAGIGEYCINIVNGKPLLEDVGRPVHIYRLEP